MERKKIGNLFADAGNAAKGAIDKTKERIVRAADKNDDGKVNFEDIRVVADALGGAVKKGAEAVKEGVEENQKKMNLKALQPVFPETLDEADFSMSKLIRITDRDKKHAENDVCQGSIGFLTNKGGLRVVNLFRDSLSFYGLSFYPDAECEFYYVNPADRDNYISLDEYFSYLKIVRINELQRVAQDLGAKHFKVTYKEEAILFSTIKGAAHGKAMKAANADFEHHLEEKKYSMIDVAAEMEMTGHAPKEPTLIYLLKDDNVHNLIHLRMTGGDNFHNHRISIKMSHTLGIKEKDAIKIDAVLRGMKVAGNASVASETRNESRRYLEYEIDF